MIPPCEHFWEWKVRSGSNELPQLCLCQNLMQLPSELPRKGKCCCRLSLAEEDKDSSEKEGCDARRV